MPHVDQSETPTKPADPTATVPEPSASSGAVASADPVDGVAAATEPETQPSGPAGESVVETRASRRARRSAHAKKPSSANRISVPWRLIRLLAMAAIAGVVVLDAYASPIILAGLLLWLSAGLAWGWGNVCGVRGWRVGFVVVLAGALTSLAVGFVDDSPYLRLVPVALAVAAVVMFLLQLVRRGGRSGLTEAVVVTSAGLALVGVGAGLVGLSRAQGGPAMLAVAMGGVVASLATDAVVVPDRWRSWLVPMALLVGGLAGTALAVVLSGPTWGAGLLVGMLSGGVAYAVRDVIRAQPGATALSAQVTAACASVLSVGGLAYVAALIL